MDAPLLYFVTGKAMPPDYAKPAVNFTRRGPVLGPDGESGTLYTACAGCLHLEYLPEKQRWTRVQRLEPQGDLVSKVWIGVDPAAPLTPDRFLRETVRDGHKVKLGDGHEWEIPVARLAFSGSGLPRRRTLCADGGYGWEVDAEYLDLSKFAERAYLIRTGGDAMVTEDDVDQACGLALAVNYRLRTDEAIALGLFTDVAMRGIVDALLDIPTINNILAAQKKTSSTPAS